MHTFLHLKLFCMKRFVLSSVLISICVYISTYDFLTWPVVNATANRIDI